MLCLHIGPSTLALLLSLLFAESNGNEVHLKKRLFQAILALLNIVSANPLDQGSQAFHHRRGKTALQLGESKKKGRGKNGSSFYRNSESAEQVWGNHNFKFKYFKLLLSPV